MKDDEMLDRAIDEAARALTTGAPRPGFSGRVRERIEAPVLQPQWPWLLAAGALAATLIFWFTFPDRPTVPTQVHSDRVADRTLPPAGQRETGEEADKAMEEHEPRGPATRRVPSLRIRIEPEAAPQIAPLAEIAELDVSVPEPGTFTVAALEIPDLNVPPVTPDFKEPR